jgi:hypothetical protein
MAPTMAEAQSAAMNAWRHARLQYVHRSTISSPRRCLCAYCGLGAIGQPAWLYGGCYVSLDGFLAKVSNLLLHALIRACLSRWGMFLLSHTIQPHVSPTKWIQHSCGVWLRSRMKYESTMNTSVMMVCWYTTPQAISADLCPVESGGTSLDAKKISLVVSSVYQFLMGNFLLRHLDWYK